jgi:MFS transporter, FHS family, L-fucose permease
MLIENTPTGAPSRWAGNSGLGGLFVTSDGKNRTATFFLVCSLFLLWGVCNTLLDDLNKHFQNSLHVTKAQSGLVQGVWYSAYFLMAFPAGGVAKRLGYRGGILTGLAIVILGALLFVPVTKIRASEGVIFALFLLVLFVLATGLVFLETIANPYTTVLGPVKTAVSRINLAQACNGIGSIVGPFIGATFILSRSSTVNTSNADLYLPYLVIAGIVAVMLIIFAICPMPEIEAPQEAGHPGRTEQQRPLLHETHYLFGIGSQFFYCAAQTGIFSFFINYVRDGRYMPSLPAWLTNFLSSPMKYFQDGEWHITEYAAGIMLSGAFIFFTVGRFSGGLILRYLPPHVLLGSYAAINVCLMFLLYLNLGWLSVIALFLSFFFMSIMYPTNFALAIRGLGDRTKSAAAGMVTAILGAGIGPIFMGWIADKHGMANGFLLPLVCFAFVGCYGFIWKSLFAEDMKPEPSSNGRLSH